MSVPDTPSISVSEKPTKHVSVPDWHGNVHDLHLLAEGQRHNASLLRNEARQARVEAVITSSWSRHKSNVQLSDRIAEVEHWRQVLENARRVLDDETHFLSEEKTTAEMEIEAYYRALSVVSECLLLRDRRSEIDLTYDEPYKQLQAELKLLECSKVELTNKCHEAWELITRGREMSTQIRDNVNDKIAAAEIDSSALELDQGSSLIANKPDVLRTPQQIIAHDSWVQAAQSAQADADTLSTQSAKLREAMKLMRDQAKMSYLQQVEATNYELRKRLYDANRLKNELEWQRNNTLDEMGKVKAEIERLQSCAAQHAMQLQCAETRQENRNLRPGEELARDGAHSRLLEEIVHLRQALRDIRDKTDTALETYNKLENLVVKLDGELACKSLCIQMEMRTVDARRNLVEHRPSSTLDKDTVLVKMDKQLAPQPMR